jgi:ribose transport system substrate-binding protein
MRWKMGLLTAGVALAVAGCGSSSSGHSTSAARTTAKTAAKTATAASATAAAAGAAIVKQAEANLAADYKGTDRRLPKSGPKAVKGKTVWVISCTQAGAGCALPAEAAVQAGTKIGWHMKVVDGKYDPAVYNSDIRDAIAAKVSGIILVAIDCPAVEGSLKAARAAGIKIYGLYDFDCTDIGGPKLFDGTISYGPLGDYANYIDNSYGKAIADYTIAKTNGQARVIELRSTDLLIVKHISAGFDKEMAKCTTCTVWKQTFTGAQFLAGQLQSLTSAMLVKHPNATVVMAPYDAAILLGMGAAVQQWEAKGNKVILLGGEGLPPNIKLIRAGLQTVAFGLPSTWAGWAAVDGLNRVFAGQPQVDPGIGHQTMDLTHNLPPAGQGYDGNAKSRGFEANYERIWGVS